MSLTVERLREVLSYDPLTGLFHWRVCFRGTRAGEQAGCIGGDKGYVVIGIDGRLYLAHRLAWFYVHGEWPKGFLDHKDNIGSHNWLDNLRPATRSQNLANSRKPRDNTSGFKGVSYSNDRRLWQARIWKDRKCHFLGRFDSPEKAHAAYAEGAKRLFGEFARVA